MFPEKIKQFIFIFYLSVSILSLSGCMVGKNLKTVEVNNENSTCFPVNNKSNNALKKMRPTWIDKEPDEKDKKLFFIGISGTHATEQDARDAAMRRARNEFAKYTGVIVNELNEFVKEIYGQKNSEVLDPVISGKKKSIEETDAFVSRMKAKEWYLEMPDVFCAGNIKKQAYQYWVLAQVPVDEYEKVQEWKRKKEERRTTIEETRRKVEEEKSQQLKAEQKTRKEAVEQEFSELFKFHTNTMERVRSLIDNNNPIKALLLLQEDWDKLVGKEFNKHNAYIKELSVKIKSFKNDISRTIPMILADIVIDTGRNGTFLTPAKESNLAISTWVWYKKNNRFSPIENVTLLLKDDSEKVVSKARSDKNGHVLFQSNDIKQGTYEVILDTSSGSLTTFGSKIITKLSLIKSSLRVIVYKPDIKATVKAAIHKLFSGPSFSELPVSSVIIGNVQYEDTRLGSGFGKSLQRQIKQELNQFSKLTVIERMKTRGLEKKLQIAARTRGIGVNGKPNILMSSPAMQAQINNAEASLEVRYFPEDNQVNIDLQLIKAMTGEIISFTTASIEKNLIPASLQLKLVPPNSDFVSLSSSKPGEISLELTTHKGDGATFVEEEEIMFYVSSDKDAYLIILYQDAAGKVVQVYPNSHSGSGFHQAEEYMAIPGYSDLFTFTIMPPFGVEQVWAFAASKPFEELQGKKTSNDLKVLQKNIEDIVSELRQLGNNQAIVYGEANLVITTVGK